MVGWLIFLPLQRERGCLSTRVPHSTCVHNNNNNDPLDAVVGGGEPAAAQRAGPAATGEEQHARYERYEYTRCSQVQTGICRHLH